MANETAVTELIIDAGAALTAAQQYDAVLDQVTDASQKAATATDTLAASITTTGEVADASRTQISQQAKAIDQYRASTDDTYTAQQKLQAGTASLAAAQQALIREVQADAITMEQYAQQTAAITLRQQELQAASAGLKDGTVDVASAMTTLQSPLQKAAAAARDQTVAHTNLANAAQALRDKIDPTAASQRNYATAVKSASDLLAAQEITQVEHTAALALAKTELDAFVNSTAHGSTNSKSFTEALVLVHETLSGNYKRAVGSATIELQSLYGAQALIGALTNPLVIGAAALAAGFIAVAVATEQVTASQREVTLALASTGDASGVSASAAEALVSQFMAAGDVTAKEARSIEADFARVGIAGTVWGQIVPSIKAYAAVTGTDLAKAQSDLASKFADPVKGAQQLDATLHLLSDSQLQDIKSLSAQGDAMSAQGILADALNVRLHGLADDGLSGLDKVLHTVSASWASFWDTLGGGGKAGTLQGQIDTAAAALAKARGTIPQLAPNPSGSVVGAMALGNVANTPGGGFVSASEAETTLSDLQEIQRKQTMLAVFQKVNDAMVAEGKAAGDLSRSLDPIGTKTTDINSAEILLNKAFNDGVISSTAYVHSMDALVRQQSNLDPVNAMTRAIQAQGRVLAQPLGLAQTQRTAVEAAQSQQGAEPLSPTQIGKIQDDVSQQQVDLLKNYNDQQTLRAAEDAVVAKAAGGTAEAQAAAANQVTLADKALAAYGLTTAQAVLAGAPLPPLLTATGAALAGISTEKFAGDLAKATTQASLHADAEARLADAAGRGDAAVRAATAANDLEVASHTSVAAVISTSIDLRTREANAITAASNATIGALNIETTSNNDMAAAVLKGNDAVVAAQLEEFKLGEIRKLGTDALIDGTKAQAAYNADLAAFVANQASAGNLDISSKIAQQNQQIDLLTQENALTGVNAQERAVLIARAQALSDIENGRVKVGADQQQTYINQAGQLVELQQKAELVQQADQARLQTAKQATNDIVKFGSETFDTLFTHTSGGWKDLWNSMKTYALKAFSDLAAEIALRPIATNVVYNILGVNQPGGAGQAQGAAALLSGGSSSGGTSLLSSGQSLMSLGSGANSLTGGSLFGGASSALDGAAASAFPSLFGAGGIGGTALGDSIAAEGGFGAELGGGVAGSGTSAAGGALGSSATGLVGTVGAGLGTAYAGYQIGSYFASQNSGSKVPGALEGAAGGAVTGAVVGSVVPGLGTAVGAIIGGVAGLLGGLLTAGKTVGPNTAANFQLNAGGTYGVHEARSDNGASDNTSEVLGAAVTQTINAFTSQLGAQITQTNAGVAQIGTMGGHYFSTVDGVEGNFSDGTAAVQDFVVRALKAADYSGIGTDVATAIQHSAATTVDGLMADAKFGQDFQQTLSDFRGGNDATTQSIQQAQASIDATFADIKTFRDTTAALGLSVADANAATDTYIQNLLDLKTVVPDSAFQTAIKTTTAEFNEMQTQMVALGYSVPEASARVTTALDAAIQSIKDTYAASYDQQLRAAQGQSYIDDLSGVASNINTNAADIRSSGRDPLQLENAQLDSDLSSLDLSQAQTALAYFEKADSTVAAAVQRRIDALQAETDATNAATAASNAATDAANQLSAGGSIRQYLNGLVASTSPTAGLAQDSSQFDSDLALAKAGDAAALQAITNDAQALLQAGQAVYASGPQQQALISYVEQTLSQLPATVSYDQQQLTKLTTIAATEAASGDTLDSLLTLQAADTQARLVAATMLGVGGDVAAMIEASGTGTASAVVAAGGTTTAAVLGVLAGMSNVTNTIGLTNLGLTSAASLLGAMASLDAQEVGQLAAANQNLAAIYAGVSATGNAIDAAVSNSATDLYNGINLLGNRLLPALWDIAVAVRAIPPTAIAGTGSTPIDRSGMNDSGGGQGGGSGFAVGGLLSGPGTGTSDSIPAMLGEEHIRLSTGEFVMNAASTARNLPTLQAMNNGLEYVHAYASGGPASGMSMINDAGPGIVRLPSGSNVMPHAASMDFLRRSVGASGIGVAGGSNADLIAEIRALRAEVQALRSQTDAQTKAVVGAVQEGDGTADEVRGLRKDVRGTMPAVGRRAAAR